MQLLLCHNPPGPHGDHVCNVLMKERCFGIVWVRIQMVPVEQGGPGPFLDYRNLAGFSFLTVSNILFPY